MIRQLPKSRLASEAYHRLSNKVMAIFFQGLIASFVFCANAPANENRNTTLAMDERPKPYLWANLVGQGEIDTLRLARLMPDSTQALLAYPSSALRIAFLGSWVRTGEVLLLPQATLWDAIMSIGGPIGGQLGVMQVIRGNETVLQVNLSQEIPRNTTLSGLGLRTGDVFILAPNYPPPTRNTWDMFREGLTVSLQVFALLGAVLSTYLTYTILHDQKKL